MRRIKVRDRAAGIIIILLASFSLTQCGQSTRSTRVNSPSAPSPQFERQFLERRIAHQRAAVDMAQSCFQKAQHVELKEFCNKLVSTEKTELEQLQGWRQAWYGGEPDARVDKETMTQGYRNFLDNVRSSSGAQFEQALLRALRLHHHEGVDESEACTSGAVHSELKTLCQTGQVEQEREIKQMSAWICQWFRDCVEQ